MSSNTQLLQIREWSQLFALKILSRKGESIKQKVMRKNKIKIYKGEKMKNIIIFTIILGFLTTASAYLPTDDCVPGANFSADNTNMINPTPTDDPDPITWTTLSPATTTARYWCPGTGVVRDTIWFLGGRLSNAASIREIVAYVPSSNTWINTGLPGLLACRRAGGGGVIGNKIYVACGRDSLSTTLSTCEEFDVDTKTVTAKASAPAAVWACAGAVAGGKLYIVGNNSYGTSCYEYDPASNTWATKAPCPVGRGWSAAAGAGGKLYVFGGGGTGSVYLSDCYEYDPATNTWTVKAPMPGPRIYHAAVAVNDQDIYVVGGSVTGTAVADNIVYKYNVASNTWTTETPMPTPRGWEMCNHVGSYIYVSYGSNCTTPTYLTTNEAGSVTPPPANDVGVDAIHVPGGTYPAGTPMSPIARIKNFGTAAQTNFSVVCSIIGTGGPVHVNTQTVASLASNDTTQLTFGTWSNPTVGNYTTKIRTLLVGDQNANNDMMSVVTEVGAWLLLEGFNGTTFPPTGWQAVIGTGTRNWERSTGGNYPTCTPYEGAAMATYQSWYATSGSWAQLISPAIPITGTMACSLKFYMTHDPAYASNADRIIIQTSPNGTTWTPVDSFLRYAASFAWTEHAVYLGSFSSNFYICFLARSAYGNNMYMDYVKVISPVSGIVEDGNNIVNMTLLDAVKPNPIKGIAHISFNIAKPSMANLRIYDASGRIIKTLLSSNLESGAYNLTWNGRDDNDRAVAEGVYFYTLETDNHSSTKKLVLTR
jgi:N-acetylneuraminic acid mutarotase